MCLRRDGRPRERLRVGEGVNSGTEASSVGYGVCCQCSHSDFAITGCAVQCLGLLTRRDGSWEIKYSLDFQSVTDIEPNLSQSSLVLSSSSPPFIIIFHPQMYPSFCHHFLYCLRYFYSQPRKNSCKSCLAFLSPQILYILLLEKSLQSSILCANLVPEF